WTDGPQDQTGTSATISSLTANTTYEVQVRATNDEGDSAWSSSGSGATNAPTNNTPVFSDTTVTRSFDENTAAGEDVGAAVEATDADTGDTVTYTLGGTDAASFDIVSSTGQIQTKTGVTYDFEAKSSYSVTVTASDGTATATATVTINVNDVEEPPSAPAAPTVSAVSGSTTSLSVSWTAPTNTGKPAIASYDLQYRQSGVTAWTDGPQDQTGTSATISSLTASTTYEVQVRATNDEGDSPWSSSGSGTTGNTTPTLVPSAPRDLRTVAAFSQISLSWDTPAHLGQSVTGYRIEAAQEGGAWTALVASQTARTYLHANLTPGSSWRYRVTALNQVGAGPVSAVVTDTANVLVSNSEWRNRDPGGTTGFRDPSKAIQLFTTGGEAHGYTLASVEVTRWGGWGRFSMEIWGARSSSSCSANCRQWPDDDDVIARLDGPTDASATTPGRVVFTAPANTHLEPNTTYAVAMIPAAGDFLTLARRQGTADDPDAAGGWSVGDRAYALRPVHFAPGYERYEWYNNSAWPVRIRGAVNPGAGESPANAEATGAPGITGAARVGEELSAGTSGISDSDGMERATFSYQWLSDGSEIAGATAQTYTVAPGDAGAVLSVRVSFTDDAGNEESLTSEPTAAVVDDGLTLASATVDGASLTLTFTELLNELVDPPETAFTVTVNGTAVTVSEASVSGSAVTLTLATAVAAGDTVTVGYEQPEGDGAVGDLQGRVAESFSGREVANNTSPPPLTASSSQVPASHDGSAEFTFELHFSEEPELSYVTLRDHAFAVTGGSVLNARRLNPPSDLGWEITVRPSGDGSVTLTLPATTDCAAAGAICTGDGKMLSAQLQVSVPGPDSPQESQQNSPATGAPTISGTAQVGQTLTVSTTGIADADGLTNVSYTYQWLADDAEISGATGSTYTLVAADQGKEIKARVSFTDDAGNAESLTSAATPAVAAANSPATGAPAISGTAQVGETLTVSTTGIADADGLTNVGYNYQWLADDAEISGATGSTYTLASGDRGKAITARVSFTDDAGNAESLTSAATAAVAPPPLTASVRAAPASHDGSAAFTFELHFSEEFELSYVTLRDHAFTVTGGSIGML
ncbi:MAG: fibronectin type III domain-containing protein, partial [Chloroflexota bacterium]|nr:fibronectin type III domain-containing protein [Chloroflexota bacterium]